MKKQTGITIAVIIVIIIIVAIAMSKRGAAPTTQMPQTETSTQQPAVENPGASLPAVQSATVTTPSVKTFTVTGSNFSFVPNTLSVNKGDTVKITFKNSGGMHNFKIDEFGVATEQLESGDSTTVQFVADKTGTFQYYCSVATHRAMGMWGTLTVH